MTLKIYGIPASRALRSMWIAKELGLPYENIPVGWTDGGTQKPEYLALNPNGLVPTIDDDGFVLWESAAINLYLAKKHSLGTLYPTALQDEAKVWQWSFWSATEVEPPLGQYVYNTVMYEPAKRNAQVAADSWQKLLTRLKVLNGAVSNTSYLLGNEFTIADFNVASGLYSAVRLKLDLSAYPKAVAYLNACLNRPAALDARKLREQ